MKPAAANPTMRARPVRIRDLARRATLALAVLVGGFAVVGSQPISAAPGDCPSGMYQFSNNGVPANSLRRLDPLTGSYDVIGDPTANVSLNAAGYHQASGSVYGISLAGNRLVRVDAESGQTFDEGELVNADVPGQTLGQRFPTQNLTVGDVAGDLLYAMVGGDSGNRNLFEIDLEARTFREIPLSYGSAARYPGGDLVHLDGRLYSVDGNGADNLNGAGTAAFTRLHVIDIASGTVESHELRSGLSPAHGVVGGRNTFGAQWLARDDSGHRMFAYENNTGLLWEVEGFAGDAPAMSVVAVTDTTMSSNDGASCPDAPVPDFDITAIDDEGTTLVDTPVDVGWVGNDRAATAPRSRWSRSIRAPPRVGRWSTTATARSGTRLLPASTAPTPSPTRSASKAWWSRCASRRRSR